MVDGGVLDDDGVLPSGLLELVVVVLLVDDLSVLVPLHLGVVGRDLDVHLDGVALLDLNVLKGLDKVDGFWKTMKDN